MEFSEGGLLSVKRDYLRLMRERLVFDICAAAFGTGYFFSFRFIEFPPGVNLWHMLALGFCPGAGYAVRAKVSGTFVGIPLFPLFLGGGI